MATSQKSIPKSIEGINLPWFKCVLGERVSQARVVEVVHGTATKVKVDLEFAGDGAAARLLAALAAQAFRT